MPKRQKLLNHEVETLEPKTPPKVLQRPGSTRCLLLNSGTRLDLGLGPWVPGFRVSGFGVAGFRVSGFRVQGFRVLGHLGFRVSGLRHTVQLHSLWS